MRAAIGLLAGTVIGAVVTIGVEAVAESTQQSCSNGTDLKRVYKRFDDLQQAITALQTQSAKAAADDALANTNNQRQLANISSQVADLNTQVLALSGRFR